MEQMCMCTVLIAVRQKQLLHRWGVYGGVQVVLDTSTTVNCINTVCVIFHISGLHLQFSVFTASHLCCVILSNEVEWSTVLSPYRKFPQVWVSDNSSCTNSRWQAKQTVLRLLLQMLLIHVSSLKGNFAEWSPLKDLCKHYVRWLGEKLEQEVRNRNVCLASTVNCWLLYWRDLNDMWLYTGSMHGH